jgi:cation:H+ antiporter
MVGISSVTIVGSADLAVGDILGSCAFNLGILSLMDFLLPKNQTLFKQVSISHILAAAFGIILMMLVGLGLFLNDDIILSPWVGLTSLTFGIVYFVSMNTIYRYLKTHPAGSVKSDVHKFRFTLRQVIIRYALFALIIIGAALMLPHFAEKIAAYTGLGQSFVGTLFLAVSTSLPEISVSIAAVRIGSADMAVGNLLGSNIFNIFILFLDDLFYTKGHLLKDASESNLISVFFVAIMAVVVIIGCIFPGSRKRIFMSWDTLIILLLYILNILLLYHYS